MEQQSNKKPKLAALKGPNIEAFQRINYLYQAAQEALPVNRELSRFYIHTMKAIAARLVLRLDPEVKRTICKKCDTLLVPGVSATVRIKPTRECHIVVTCDECGAVKRWNVYKAGKEARLIEVREQEKQKEKEKEMQAEKEREENERKEAALRRSCLLIQKSLKMRLLYTNPVCLLTVNDITNQRRNIMTITWLTCINNQGLFFCSINLGRYTKELLTTTDNFVLNVPVEGMEEVVLAIGACSGRDTNKFEKFNIPLCKPGWFPLTDNETQQDIEPMDTQPQQSTPFNTTNLSKGNNNNSRKKKQPPPPNKKKQQQAKTRAENEEIDKKMRGSIAVASCVAHMECSVVAREEKEGHMLTQCYLHRAWVKAPYWDGKNFVARPNQEGKPSVPPYLTFMGSQKFAYVYPPSSTTEKK